MAHYLFIESRDPFESAEVAAHVDLAAGLARGGDQVTVFLVQNGVLAARRGAQADVVARLAAAGVEVLADDFSLRERAIAPARLAPEVQAAPITTVVDRLERGDKALWH